MCSNFTIMNTNSRHEIKRENFEFSRKRYTIRDPTENISGKDHVSV